MTVTAKCLVESAFAASSAATVYTVPGSTKAIIDKFTATNTDGSTRTVTIYLVPSGGSAGTSNQIIQARSISAGATSDITELQNQILNTGDFISVLASAGSLVVIRASGREIT